MDSLSSKMLSTTSNRMGNKLYRRLLPFYMKLPVFWAFIVLSVLGQLLWVVALSYDVRIDLRWSSVGYGLGVGLGFMQGKWTSRLWDQSYIKVLKRQITFWDAKGAKLLTFYTCFALGLPILCPFLIRSLDTLAGIQSYVFGFIGAMNVALLLWVRRMPK